MKVVICSHLPRNSDRKADQALNTLSDHSNLVDVAQSVRPASYTRPIGIQSVADIVGSTVAEKRD